jgi:uncharacterized membrane protein
MKNYSSKAKRLSRPFSLFIQFSKALIGKVYCSRTELEKALMLSSLFSIGLTLFRVFYTREWMFVWLGWNLFLALLPYLISRSLIRRPAWIENTSLFVTLASIWLLFLPNSFYIITDLFHLHLREGIPYWFDLALIFSFAWNGILLGAASIRQMEKLVSVKWPAIKEWQFVYPLMLLNAFGIYIGRYLRYNSWDVVANPFQLTEDILYLLLHPVQNRFDWSMIVCYAVFMSLIYIAIKRMSRSLW